MQQKEGVFQNIWKSIAHQVEAADYLDNRNFTVSEHVLLPHYFDHVKTFSKSDEKQIDFQLQSQRKMFLEVRLVDLLCSLLTFSVIVIIRIL